MADSNASQSSGNFPNLETFNVSQGEGQSQGHGEPTFRVYRAPIIRTNSGGSLPINVRNSAPDVSLMSRITGHWSAPVSTINTATSVNGNTGSPVDVNGDYGHILNAEEGWDLVFITRSEKFDCPICLLVLREPMQTECGHRFCRGCILKWLRESKSICPIDNQPLDERQLFKDNWARREILGLSVKCPNHEKGCDQITTLNQLKSHLELCLYSLTSCPNRCANILYRGQLSQHLLRECQKRLVKCSHCQSDVVAELLKEHDAVCPENLINCSACGQQFKRIQLSHHIHVECLKTTTKCQYHALGCDFEDERGRMEDHEKVQLTYHMSLINRGVISICAALKIDPTNQQQHSIQTTASIGHHSVEGPMRSDGASFPPNVMNPKDSMNLLQQIFQRITVAPREMNDLSGADRISPVEAVIDINDGASGLFTHSGIGLLQPMPPTSQPAIVLQNVAEEQEQTQSERVNTDQTQTQKVSYFFEPSNRDDNEMPHISMPANELRSMKCQNDLQDESLARHDQSLCDLKHQNECQDKLIRELRVKVKSLENMMQDFEGRCGNGVYLWKIKNYFKLRREAERGEITAVHSNSFYSCYYGYKLCIRVNLNGVDSARGTHLSLFIHFMQGEYDDLLEWPFNGRIVLTVIDQNPICEQRNDISETLLSKSNLAAFQRPTSARNHKGFGYMEFLPLNVIDGSTYVKNDTLIIKATVIPSTT
ncbi:TNF receptor-associated factor 6 [Mactra antiquata]